MSNIIPGANCLHITSSHHTSCFHVTTNLFSTSLMVLSLAKQTWFCWYLSCFLFIHGGFWETTKSVGSHLDVLQYKAPPPNIPRLCFLQQPDAVIHNKLCFALLYFSVEFIHAPGTMLRLPVLRREIPGWIEHSTLPPSSILNTQFTSFMRWISQIESFSQSEAHCRPEMK